MEFLTTSTSFPDAVPTYGIPIAAILGVLFAIFLWQRVSKIRVGGESTVRSENGREYLLEEEQRGENEVRLYTFGSFPKSLSRTSHSFHVYVYK